MVPSDSYSYIGFKGEKRWAWEKATSRWTAFYGRSWPLSTTWKNPEHLHRLFDVLPEQTDNMWNENNSSTNFHSTVVFLMKKVLSFGKI